MYYVLCTYVHSTMYYKYEVLCTRYVYIRVRACVYVHTHVHSTMYICTMYSYIVH